MPDFLPGRELARAFYDEVVASLVDAPHSAAFVGWGSDVLGFDTGRSTDHGWGPRLQVFVAADDVPRVAPAIERALPDDFRGWRTRFGWDEHPVTHHVEVTTLGAWLRGRLGFDPRHGITTRDWLVTPQQRLLELTAGAVFHDGLGELEPVRRALAWYPDDVWLWLLACQWRRIDQEEPFVGRAAEVGDELGSRVIAARLVRDLVRMCFLLERRYAPYSKWLGSAFRRLDAHHELGEPLLATLAATDFAAREDAFVEALRRLAGRHNALGVTRRVSEDIRRFHSRPFRVLGAGRFVDACLERVGDEQLRTLPLVGAVDQISDSTDVLETPEAFRSLTAVYGVESRR
jgi:Domain of unknown function (DUF4037)